MRGWHKVRHVVVDGAEHGLDQHAVGLDLSLVVALAPDSAEAAVGRGGAETDHVVCRGSARIAVPPRRICAREAREPIADRDGGVLLGGRLAAVVGRSYSVAGHGANPSVSRASDGVNAPPGPALPVGREYPVERPGQSSYLTF